MVYTHGESSPALSQPVTTSKAPTPADSRATHLARCRMVTPVLLPAFEHADRAKAVGVIEVACAVAQPLVSFAFLSSLVACLQVSMGTGQQPSGIRRVICS